MGILLLQMRGGCSGFEGINAVHELRDTNYATRITNTNYANYANYTNYRVFYASNAFSFVGYNFVPVFFSFPTFYYFLNGVNGTIFVTLKTNI